MGDVEIVYEESRWDVSPSQPSTGATEGALFFCTAPECRKRPVVGVTATPIGAPLNGRECPATKSIDAIGGFRSKQLTTGNGMTFTLIRTHGGCRAYTPAHHRACATDGRFNYTLASGSHFGCSGIEGVPEALLAELIAGIRPVPAAEPQPAGDR